MKVRELNNRYGSLIIEGTGLKVELEKYIHRGFDNAGI